MLYGLGLILNVVFSWAVICGIIKIITLCFDITFNLAVATGVWLTMGLLRSIFNKTK